MSRIAEELERQGRAIELLGLPSLYRIVAEHGREYEAQPLPQTVKKAPPKECFANAIALAMRTGMTYVEGYGMRPNVVLGWLVHHAWCVDEHGRVVDPTWENPEEAEYYGIEFDLDYVIALGYTGMALEEFAKKIIDEERAKEKQNK